MSEAGEPIGAALGRLAREDPDRPAVTVGGLSVTRGELDRRSNRLARAFAAAGVGPEDLVTIALPNSAEFVEAAAACPTYRYLGAEARTIGDGWESLGDMGWFDEEGYLYLADRRADMILSGGANIYPAEIEAALNEHQVIESCAVIGLPDDDLGQVVHAICHASPGSVPPRDEELRAFVAERLARYKVPRSFEWVSEPVRDDAGKVRRSALRSERVQA